MLALFPDHVGVFHGHWQRRRTVIVVVDDVVVQVADGRQQAGRQLNFVIDVQKEGDAAVVGVVADVGSAADDRNSFKSRQGHSQRDADVRPHPE